MLAIMFPKKVDMTRFEGLRTDLNNRYSRGMSQYPHNLSAAYSMITSHLLTVRATPEITDTSRLNLLHTSTGYDENNIGQEKIELKEQIAPIWGIDEKLHISVRFYGYNSFGNYAIHCPGEATAAATGSVFFHMDMAAIEGSA